MGGQVSASKAVALHGESGRVRSRCTDLPLVTGAGLGCQDRCSARGVRGGPFFSVGKPAVFTTRTNKVLAVGGRPFSHAGRYGPAMQSGAASFCLEHDEWKIEGRR